MKRIACIRWNDDNCKLPIDALRQQLVDRCRRYSPLVGWEATDKESLLLDITGVAHLFGGETALARSIAGELASLGLSGRMAIAETVGAAWAASKWGKAEGRRGKEDVPNSTFPLPPSPLLIVPPGETAAFLNSLPVEALRLPDETVRLLRELGLRTIGQLEALPREGFLARFGPLLLCRLDQAFGRVDEPVPGAAPLPRFAAQWLADYPITKREMIEAVLERLVQQVGAMLIRAGRGALRFECRLEFERDATDARGFLDQRRNRDLSMTVGLFQPTAAASHLDELVGLQFEQLRIPSPVIAIRVAATLTAPLEPHRQAALFDFGDGNAAHDAQPGQLAALVERLSSRLGSTAVLGVRLRPEAQPELAWHYDSLVGNRRRNLAGTRHAPAERPTLPPRPLRLLPRPRLLDCGPGVAPALFMAGGTPAPQLPLRRFRLGGQEHQIARHSGPERIETGWWRGRLVGRDYFRVETTSGNRYWLFRRLRDGKWFIHGVFE